MRARRRNKETNVREFVAGSLSNRIQRLMDNRRKILAPFPIVAEEIYRMLFTSQELHALHVLQQSKPDLLEHLSYFNIDLPSGAFIADFRPQGITITLEKPMPLYETHMALNWAALPDRTRESIREWMMEWWKLTQETAALCQQVHHVGQICSTYGQLFRLWPDLEGLLGETGRDKINSAKSASPYPRSACTWEWSEKLQRNVNTGLQGQYKPEVFAVFSCMLAECLMLPTMDHKEVGTVNY